MASNYGEYIRPEVWPIPVEAVGLVIGGRYLPGGMVEIRAIGTLYNHYAGRAYILDVAPREHAYEVMDAIDAYCNAYRKLIG